MCENFHIHNSLNQCAGFKFRKEWKRIYKN